MFHVTSQTTLEFTETIFLFKTNMYVYHLKQRQEIFEIPYKADLDSSYDL